MIKSNETHFPVGMMCHLLSVSRSGYYAWKRRLAPVREQSARLLKIGVKRVFGDEKGRAGTPRVARRPPPYSKDYAGQRLASEGDHQQQASLASSP